MNSFFRELKNRHVYRVAIGYAVSAWLMVQVASIVLTAFRAPSWILQALIVFAALGFPAALVLGWVFETRVIIDQPGAARLGRRHTWLLAVIGLGFAAIALAGYWFWRASEDRKTETAAAYFASPEKSVAVLPFENLSDQKENQFFTDGVQDEILTALARISELKVISRTSVMQYKDSPKQNLRVIGQQLGVTYVLEGSVQRIANRVRVMAQLLDARNDAHIWAEHYDAELADVFAIQSEIAQKIADQLQAKLTSTERKAIEQRPTRDVAAYDAYLRAKELSYTDAANREESLRAAERLLTDAIQRDPAFQLAHCALANVHDIIYDYGFDRSKGRLALADEQIRIALELNPDSGEAHLARALHYQLGSGDLERAKDELTLAARSLPNDVQVLRVLASIQRTQGNWEEAARNLEKAAALAPRSSDILDQLAFGYQCMRRYADQRRVLERGQTLPGFEFIARWELAWSHLDEKADTAPAHALLPELNRQSAEAVQEFALGPYFLALLERDKAGAERALASMPPAGITSNLGPCPKVFYEALLATCFGERNRARAAYEAARKDVEANVRAHPEFAGALCLLGFVDAGLGQKEPAIREGRRAVELTPLSQNAVLGATLMFYLSLIYTEVGEKELALRQLEQVSKVPCPGFSYGWGKLLPLLDPLRQDPRFTSILMSLAPK